jgi:MFS family permease
MIALRCTQRVRDRLHLPAELPNPSPPTSALGDWYVHITGNLSDHIGRHRPNVWGIWICGAGVAMMQLNEGAIWWSLCAAVSGFGMALLYPNLSAAIADMSHPNWRGSAIGIYRFWRDLGYGIGALGLGIAARFSGTVDAAFWFVAASMFLSGGILWAFGEETHPRLAQLK